VKEVSVDASESDDRSSTAKRFQACAGENGKKEEERVSKVKNGLVVLLGILLVAGILSAQTPTGKLFGVVTDEDGNPLPGVNVEATSVKLMGKAATVTDASGLYRLFALQPGTYKVTFTLQGFKPLIRDGIVLNIEQTLKLDAALQMGALEEEVTVIGQSPLIDVKSTTKGMTLTKEMFEVLPRGRNFDTLATAVPGVNYEPNLGGLSVDGASGAENMFYIDGTEINRTDIGTRGQSAAFEFVDEVKITASGYPAEFGGAVGGVVNVVTRQGGNEFHGELIGYYEGSHLTGKERDTVRLNPSNDRLLQVINFQDEYGKPLQHRYEGGFSLGGYILKDRLWFFGSFLPVYNPITRAIDWTSTEAVDNAKYTQKNYAYNFQVKLTAQPFSFMRVGVSYVNNFTKYRGNLPSRDGTGDSTDIYADYGYSYPNYTAQGFADLTFGNNFMVNLRGGRFYYNTTGQQVHPTTPQYYFLRSVPASLGVPDEYVRAIYWRNHPLIMETNNSLKYKNYANADFTYYLNFGGEHALKFGVGWLKQGEVEDQLINPEYAYIRFQWNRTANVGGVSYGRGQYGFYEVRGGPVSGQYGGFWDVYNERWAAYLQDAWTIADRFTLNVGIRAETEYLPPYANPADIPAEYASWRPMDFGWGDKLAPRVGFVYDVFGDASLKVFGSYGLYFDVIKTYMAAHSYSGFKWKTAYYTLDSYEWDKIGVNGYYPGTLLTVYDWRHPSFDTTDPDLKPVSQRELSFGIEKMLMENVSLTARFVNKHLRHVIEDVGFQVPGVGEVYYEANPGYGYTLHIGNGTGKMDPNYPETPKAKREYYAVNVSLDKRLSNNWLAGISYTWSQLTGNCSGLAASDEFGRVSPYVERQFDNWAMTVTKDLEYTGGPLNTDRTHFIKFYGAYTFPFRLTVGTVINAMSGTPFTEMWSLLDAYMIPFDRNHYREGTTGNDIKSKRTPFLWFANVYAEYNLRIGKYTLNFNVNVDNVFNIATARRLYEYRTLYDIGVNSDTVLSKNWDLASGEDFVEDPRFGQKMNFYDPIAARFGVKFIF
jgi:hypothetical protein